MAAVAKPFPQLLMAYDPSAHAEAIRVHVDAIRAKGHVWWGRFHKSPERLDKSAARAKWGHVAALIDARAAGEPLLLYVTDFVALHVCKVTRAVFGDSATMRGDAPSYYGERPIPLWFLVEDVRALSFDHHRTAHHFATLGAVTGAWRGGDAPYEGPYDPRASIRYGYPIVVGNGRSCTEMFAAKNATKKRWADDDDTVLSRPVKRARDGLAKQLSCWPRFDPMTCDELAQARYLLDGVASGDLDVSVSFGRFSVAIERELCKRLCGSFGELAKRLTLDGWPLGSMLADRVEEPTTKGGFTMGDSLSILRHLANKERSALKSLRLETVTTLAQDLAWLDDVRALRNHSTHASSAERAKMKRVLDSFFKGRGSELVALLDARDTVEKWCAT